MSLRDAYFLCKNGRPVCFPNLGFWNQLITYEYQLRKDNSVKSTFSFFEILLIEYKYLLFDYLYMSNRTIEAI